MLLTMRPTGGHSPVYADRQDWTILDDGKPVGRIYEHAGAGTPADRRFVSRAQNQVRRCLMLRASCPALRIFPPASIATRMFPPASSRSGGGGRSS